MELELLIHTKRNSPVQSEVALASGLMLPGGLSGEVFQACLTRRKPRADHGPTGKTMFPGWPVNSGALGKLVEVVGERAVWISLGRRLHEDPRPR